MTCGVEFGTPSATVTDGASNSLTLTPAAMPCYFNSTSNSLQLDFGSVSIPADGSNGPSTYGFSVTPDVKLPSGSITVAASFQ